jgi:membrane protease YdiL (CAAX protease family)
LLLWVVLLMVPARFVFSIVAQATTALVLWIAGDTTPWVSSAGWWTVYGTLTDILCLLALVWALRIEGRRLRDLVVLGAGGLRAQFTAIPLYLLALVPFVAGSALIAMPFYSGAPPGQIAVIDLPVWATVFSVAVWPLVWAVTEQLFYLGYLLPRLERLTGRTWLAVAIVVVAWGAQHLAIPFIADGTYLLSRLLTALLVALGMTLVFVLLRRRLVTTTLIHWVADAPTALLPLVLVAAN